MCFSIKKNFTRREKIPGNKKTGIVNRQIRGNLVFILLFHLAFSIVSGIKLKIIISIPHFPIKFPPTL